MIDRRAAAEVALSVAREAAQLVMRVYAKPFDVEFKVGDDPVTRADREANDLACERLARAFPGVPVVAEESDPRTYAGFAQADAAWFVDPLDGTREFVARNGEFVVMIGLAERGHATVGAIVVPDWGRAFLGVVGEAAWEVAANGARTPIHVSTRDSIAGASFVVSRSREPDRVKALAASMGAREAVSRGSSGLKGVLVATGVHDVYLQPGNAGMRWDACATEALVCAAGGECTEGDATRFDYRSEDLVNARGLVATNGLLHGSVMAALREKRPA
ncbi:MAG TPA: 3'(2'),5'-bisphosphate nucleotidase CysQ [Polyangiaceae bacterium]|nr:3'(2'),5'-bisphosphate nucleotidase CysQ [Polyangiaceae bacterium]